MELVTKQVPKGVFTIAPIGDIQYGAAGCAASHLREWIERGLEEGWWFLGMGDYLDAMSPSNRRRMLEARVGNYDSVNELIDDAVTDKMRELTDGPLAGTKGRWLGMSWGDHSWVFEDGQESDHFLAQRLGATYLGTAFQLQVTQKGVDRPLKIFGTHGRGSSVSATGKTLHLERLLNSMDADIALMGHSHLKYGFPKERLKTVLNKRGDPRLYAEKRIGAITGSWLKGYEAGTRSKAGIPSGSYVEAGAMAPVPIGGILIHCRPKQHDWGWEWDLSVEA